MSPKASSQTAPKTYARLYCTPKEREEWTQTARNRKYETFSDFARTAIEMLCANPHLPDILEKNQGRATDENMAQIMRILTQIEAEVRT
ncbi:MAG: hypothetical protein ACE5OZ_08825 [Candidatus Heimdallarchaeota archaeon]